MNQAQEQAMMEASHRKQRAIQAGRIAAECESKPPLIWANLPKIAREEENYGQAEQGNPNTCTIHQQDARDLEAIMERRRLNNYSVERTYKEIIEQLHEASEEDAVRIARLEQIHGESNSAMACIRDGLRFMQSEWGPLLDAMFKRQKEAEEVIEQMQRLPAKCQSTELEQLTGQLLRVLRNDPQHPKNPYRDEAGNIKAPEVFYYCPTCNRHVHPEDLVWTEDQADGNGYRHVHTDGEGKLIASCPGFVEVHQPKIPAPPSSEDWQEEANRGMKAQLEEHRAYLAKVDAEFARLGATRTEEDGPAIKAAKAAGHSPASVAEYLYNLALKRNASKDNAEAVASEAAS